VSPEPSDSKFRVGLHYRAHTRRLPAERAVHLDPCHPDNNNNGPISNVGPSISSVTFDIKCSFDIDVLHLRYRMSISKVIDIEGHKSLIMKAMNRVVDIEVSCLRYR
jgi:hypothetical protein